jgi:hypothetical protein
MRKNTRSQWHERNASEQLDNWLHALAFVISRRQMRGRWMGRLRSSSATPAY